MSEHAVVIAGGGPTGMMLGAELTLAGVDVVLLERRAGRDLESSRAGGLHCRTIEVLDQRGVADRFLDAGETAQVASFAGVPVDVSQFPTRHPYALALWQSHFERILAGWLDELGVPVLGGRAVVGLAQDDRGVDIEVSDGSSLRARYLVGCDGGRSVVRKAAGIDFPGLEPTTSWMIAECEMAEEPQLGLHPAGGGIGPVNWKEGGNPYRAVIKEHQLGDGDEPSLDDLRAALVAAYGSDFGVHRATWISRFTDASRQAASYRAGRVLLAGDAAHIHPPQGGQGLNVGVQDAVNLGWKLAQVVHGTSPDALLDTYHAERHPIGARVQRNTRAAIALGTLDDRHESLREILGELLALDEPSTRISGEISGLDVHYDLGAGHPLLGWRMPDLDLQTTDGPTRVAALLHHARPVLLDLGARLRAELGPWSDRVQLVDAACEGAWALPVVGEVPAPRAVLIRPDGHVAWAGDRADPALRTALETWFGAPVAA